jgi:hypothetical protein
MPQKRRRLTLFLIFPAMAQKSLEYAFSFGTMNHPLFAGFRPVVSSKVILSAATFVSVQ